MKVSLIVAVADNRVIGRDNRLPWRLSADLRRFKALTMGHHLLVGRKTWESIGRPLPGRTMIVVSRGAPELPADVHLCRSVVEGIEQARMGGDDEVFIAGGAAIYAASLPLADRLYVTHVRADVDGDTHLPALDFDDWAEVSREEVGADADNEYPTAFAIYERPR